MMDSRYGSVIWTNHAIERLYERGIVQSDAWYTFQHPDGQLSGSIPRSIKYYKDYGGQRIEVVTTQNEKKEWVILSCWSKFVGTGQPLFKQGNVFWFVLKRLFQLIWQGLIPKKKHQSQN